MISKSSLELHNVFIYKGKEQNIVHLDDLAQIGTDLRSVGIYLTGPVIIHKMISQEELYEVWLPMNGRIQLENDSDGFFCDRVEYTNCLFSRNILEESSIEKTSEKMEQQLKEEGIAYNDVFYAVIPIPNGKVVDIYIPMQGESEHE